MVDGEGVGVWLYLLGGFTLRIDGATEVVPQSSQRVLAFLALQRHPPIRSRVAGTLWPERTEERAAGNLRSAIWRLPGGGHELLAVSPTHLALASTTQCDVTRLVERAHRLTGDHGPLDDDELEATLLESDLLPDWSDEWLVADRARVRQLRVHSLDALSADLTRLGRHSQAIEVGLASIAADPFRETAHRAVIQAHLAERNHAEALRQYRRFSEMLSEELGMAPSEALEQLVQRSTPE